MKNTSSTFLYFIKCLIGVAVIIFGTLLISTYGKNFQINLVNVGLILFFCVAGHFILLGLGGMLGLCSITFLGLGSFMCGFLNTRHGVPILFAMLCGMLASGISSFLLGLLLLRLEGRSFVFGTIGVVYIGSSIFQSFTAFTGGPDGTSGIEKVELFGYKLSTFSSWLPVLGVFAMLLIMLLYRIKATSFGRSLMAIRDDETAAYMMGINVYWTKVFAFTIAGLLAGFGGAIYAVHSGTISASLFTFSTQTRFIVMLMLGGVGSPIGALGGTLFVNMLPEFVRFSDSYLFLIYGIVIVVLMVFMPMGISGVIKNITTKITRKLNPRR